MTPPPLVTIVTPVFNQEKYILDAAHSIISQSYPHIEYIIINDGSTDQTSKLLRTLPDGVTVLNQANAGQSAALNRGWSIANGKYLGYLSSDDLYHPELVRKMVDVLESNSDVVCVFPNCDHIDENGRVIKRSVCRPFSFAELLVKQACYIGVGAIFRASAFVSEGGWRTDLRLTPDREFWLRLARAGRIEFVDETLAHYRMHGGSTSFGDVSAESAFEFLSVTEEYFSHNNVLPVDVRGREKEARSYAYLIAAKFAIRRGDINGAIMCARHAVQLNADFRRIEILLVLVKTGISKPVRKAINLILNLFRI